MFKRIGKTTLAIALALPSLSTGVTVFANDENAGSQTDTDTETSTSYPAAQDGYTYVSSVTSASKDANSVTLTLEAGERIRFTFLEGNVFRMYMAAPGEEFQEYPTPNSSDHLATITEKSDAEYYTDYKVDPQLIEDDATVTMMAEGGITITVDKASAMMTVTNAQGETVVKEAAPIQYREGSTIQTLATSPDEYFYGGGTQNGRFSHKGEVISISNTNNWVDGGVASPNPFYWSTKGYGVVRNTWKPGSYDFTSNETITTTHNEERFDAYFFIDDSAEGILKDYYELTGNPTELPEYAWYLGHLNCYNRDYWVEVDEGTSGAVKLGDKWYKESQTDNGGERETLNNDDDISARAIINEYEKYDMPFGWFLPNDGYGCGYGQSDTFQGDLDNLEAFADYAITHGVQTGLWTQSNLWPADQSNPQKGERYIYAEVDAGVHAVKTDVAWVGAGYSMALNGISVAYDAIVSRSNMKPTIVTLDGWAGTQRYGGIWTGDQSGGQWEYIRFHIPTYIGTSLSGQPNIGSDMDGIFGGADPIIWTRDFQWKTFTTYMLDMDGWGSNQKSPWAMGQDGTSINRAYLKLKAQLMPYINTVSHEATAEGGLPIIRAMFLEEENPYTLGTETQYQYMFGDNFLVAPIYQDTASDEDGNDIRNDIYLPSTSDVWIDYFTGEQYRGGQILNYFDAPIWKLPLFVKNGSIIPMYPENNNPEAVSDTNPKGLDDSQRIVEFWPAGSTEFEAYEDDGKTLGGAGTTTMYTSVVDGDTATLTANATVGQYTGMTHERSTEFIVNVSQEPTAVTGSVAGEDVTFTKVNSMAELEEAEGNVYFYDPSPSVYVTQFADEDSSIADLDATSTPKLYVKSGAKTNISEYDFQVVVKGFANEQTLPANELDETLAVPANLQEVDKSDDYITVGWDAVEAAAAYDIEVDGVVFNNIEATTYTQDDLDFSTEHTYRVRTVSADGHYSNWSDEITLMTDDDPFRNTPYPTNIDWEGTIYSNRVADLAFDHTFQIGDGGFHSGGGDIGKALTVDYGMAYQLDKIEYYPRDDAGNGTVTQMEIATSIDGIHWSDGQVYTFARDNTTKTVEMDGVTARYVRFIPRASVGGFFSASEILVYKVDGTNGSLVGDVNHSGTLDENDLTFFENYIGLIPSDSDFEYIKDSGGDIDGNDIVDAYDLSYVARQLNGGISNPADGVDGKIMLIPDKKDIKAGDTVNVSIYGIGLENVNAFSVEFHQDDSLFTITNPGVASVSTAFMRNFSKLRPHTATSEGVDNYTVFTNIGFQDLINGTGTIATFTLTANADFTWGDDRVASSAVLVGQDLSTVDAIIDLTDTPTLPETSSVLKPGNGIESITFDNEHLDGSDGSELWEQSDWESILFDGATSGNMAEFMWYYGEKEDNIGAEVMLPTDFNIDLDGVRHITNFTVYGRTSGNGAPETSKLVAYNGDEVVYESEVVSGATPTFAINADVDRIVWTPLTSSGTATGSTTGTEENRMLSLFEIVIEEDGTVDATGIAFDDSNVTEMSVGDFAEVSATVAPSNVTNPFYDITSGNEDIVTVTKIPMGDHYTFLVQAVGVGEATLTATSEDGEFTSTMTITVNNKTNTDRLQDEIDAARAMYAHMYTDETWAAVEEAIDNAEALILSGTATKAEIDNATIELMMAVDALEFRGSNDEQPDSTNLIPYEGMSMFDESSCSAAEQEHASYVIDGKRDTLWHSNYNSGYSLPQWFTIDLGGTYNLEQVDYLQRQTGITHNGAVSHYRIEVSLDGETFMPVVEGYFEVDGDNLKDPSEFKKVKFDAVEARYVRFIALESLGDTPNAYASCAEMNFYGTLVSAPGADFSDLQEAIAAADALDAEEYTTSSWAAFETVLNAAKELTEESSAEQISNAIASLSAAQAALETRASDAAMAALQTTVNNAEALRDQYTSEAFANVDAAIQAANALLAEPADASATAAVSATLNISVAVQQLNVSESTEALKADLEETIANAKVQVEEAVNARPGQIDAVNAAIAAGETVLADAEATADDYKEAITNITKAVQELWDIVSKDELNAVIEEAEAITAEGYTEDSYNALQNAITAAKEVAANDDATTTDVTNAITSVLDAIAGLVHEDLDTSALEGWIETVEQMVANIDDYRPSTVVGLEDKLNEAKDVLANATTQAEIDEAAEMLREAALNARTKADVEALVAAIEEAEAIDLSQYTAASAQAVRNAVANAKLLVDDPEATQEAVDAATNAILSAIDNLQDVTTVPGGSSDEPGTTPGGNDDTNTGNQSGTDAGNGNGGTQTDGSGTAAENSTAGFAAMSVIALGALAAIFKKRTSLKK